ncbi:MAG: lysophospholipid acyltransferase family protein [Alphaproteobacteria bacterium]|nr:lysophospholipid acyltransferase family protein [Alphaproteobacteria bacterium]
MNPEEMIRQSHRHPFQKWVTDPLFALLAGIVWLFFKILPVRWASAIGGQLGILIGKVMHRRSHIGLINLKIAFPDKSETERRTILKKMWQHWGRFYAEMPHAHTLFKKAEIRGLTHLKKAVAENRGGFVCSAHLGNWELAVSQPLFDDFYLNPVYRRANNPWLDKLMFQRRKGVLIPKGAAGARKMVEVLHHKGFIVMLCDQKLREGMEIPLFGKPALTAPAIAVLALKFKVPILMARSIRQPDGHFIMDVTEPLSMPQESDSDKAVRLILTEINRRLESWIRENPEQWLWVHRRFDKEIYRNPI